MMTPDLAIMLAFIALASTADHPSTFHKKISSYGHKPAYKHTYCDSTLPPACANNSIVNYCLEDQEYPEYEIKGAISADYLFSKKYADVGYEETNLVERLTSDTDASFNYDFYTGASTGPFPYDATHWAGGAGYACPSHVKYTMPKRAKNVAGKWQVIVNHVYFYTQSVRLESCLFPESACRALSPCELSHCTQKYAYHRLLSWNPCDPYRGLFIDIYKLPSFCSCLLPVHSS